MSLTSKKSALMAASLAFIFLSAAVSLKFAFDSSMDTNERLCSSLKKSPHYDKFKKTFSELNGVVDKMNHDGLRVASFHPKVRVKNGPEDSGIGFPCDISQ